MFSNNNSSQKSENPLNETRKRPSAFNKTDFEDYIVLEGDQNEIIDDDDDDEEDLDYAGNFKKRKSIANNRTVLNTPKPSTSKDINQIQPDQSVELSTKQYLADRIDRISEFAQVLMHCLLYKINYYNKKTHFEKFIKYNIIVYVTCTYWGLIYVSSSLITIVLPHTQIAV